jgi:hypothetical protein
MDSTREGENGDRRHWRNWLRQIKGNTLSHPSTRERKKPCLSIFSNSKEKKTRQIDQQETRGAPGLIYFRKRRTDFIGSNIRSTKTEFCLAEVPLRKGPNVPESNERSFSSREQKRKNNPRVNRTGGKIVQLKNSEIQSTRLSNHTPAEKQQVRSTTGRFSVRSQCPPQLADFASWNGCLVTKADENRCFTPVLRLWTTLKRLGNE